MEIKFRTWTVPPALLIVCVLSFGLLIPILGFYWDDWPAILTIRLQGVDAFWDFYRGERPFSAWTFILFAPLFGTNQLGWHMFTLFLRWLTIFGLWWSMRLLWPKRGHETTWIALLFAIYPVFLQQPVAVAFSQHWISYALYFFSLIAMMQSTRVKRWSWLLMILGMVLSGLHMLTMEYFIGLELLRPVFLWIITSDKDYNRRRRMQKTIIRWIPYLLILAGVIIWRLFFMEITGEDPNRPVLLYNLLEQPFETSLRLVQFAAQDLLMNLFGSWYLAIIPNEFNLTDRLYLNSLVLGAISTGLVIFYLLRFTPNVDEDNFNNPRWYKQAIAVGFLATLMGSLPVWVTDRQVLTGLYGGRFGMAAMFGLSVLVVGLLDWLTPRRFQKIILIGGLVGIAVAFHLRSTSTYYKYWVKQHQFYWQLSWRAPYIKPGTAILSTDELFLYVGRNPTAMALNLLYPQPKGNTNLAYWFVELTYNVGLKGIPTFVEGRDISFNFRNYSFNGSSLDSLAIFYEPEDDRCLWVLSPEDDNNPEIPGMTEDVLPVSDLDRIITSPPQKGYPPIEIYGKEPSHNWCYFYQKADLARQMGDWVKVVQLVNEALAKGYKPRNPHERLPFIEAYAHTGQWEEAIRQTVKAIGKNPKYAARLCRLWDKIEREVEMPPGAGREIIELRTELQCEVH